MEQLVSRMRRLAPYRCEDCGVRTFMPRVPAVSPRRGRRLSLAEHVRRLEGRSRVPPWMFLVAVLVTAIVVALALMYAERPLR